MLGGALSPAFCWRCLLGYERFEKAMLVILPICLFKLLAVALLDIISLLPMMALPLELFLNLFLLVCWWRCSSNTYSSIVTLIVRLPVVSLLVLNMIAQVVYATTLH
jgi:hypothetical protein